MFVQKQKNTVKKNQIEGHFEKGKDAILVEDLISSGQSSLEAASSLKQAGVNVKGIVSIFTYGFDTASKNFKNDNYIYHSLCDYNILLEQAIEQEYIKNEDLSILKEWRKDPSNWKK
jgi:orotate phosphoribosyltransferase